MKKTILILFVIIVIGELISSLISVPVLHLVCKPLLLILLIGYYVVTQRESGSPISKVLLLALIFSWGGDVLLMGNGELYFMLGLASFLAAHVFYIFTFRQLQLEDDTQALQGLQRIRFAFPIILYGSGLVVILYGRLGDLKIPVLLYALVLTLMVLNALLRFGRTSTPSFVMVFAGALLFMISDSILAVNKFLEPISYSGFWIMSTYISAQLLIVTGLLKHEP